MTSTFFAALALAGAAAFLATVWWAHWRRPELDPAQASLSHYLTDATRRGLIAGYAALVVAMLCLPIAALSARGFNAANAILVVCFAVAALALIPVVVTTRPSLSAPDPRSARSVTWHRHAAWLAFVASSLGILGCAAAGVIATPTAWFPLSALLLAVINNGLCVATLRPRSQRYGLVQKALIASIVVWIAGEAFGLLLAQ